MIAILGIKCLMLRYTYYTMGWLIFFAQHGSFIAAFIAQQSQYLRFEDIEYPVR